MENRTAYMDLHRIVLRARDVRDELRVRKENYANPDYKKYNFTCDHHLEEYKAYRREEREAIEKLEMFYKGMCKLILDIYNVKIVNPYEED